MLFETEFVLVFSFPAYFWGKHHGKPERIEDENVELFPLRGAVWRERVERGRLDWFDLTPAWFPFREPMYRMKYPRRGELAAAKAPLGELRGFPRSGPHRVTTFVIPLSSYFPCLCKHHQPMGVPLSLVQCHRKLEILT